MLLHPRALNFMQVCRTTSRFRVSGHSVTSTPNDHKLTLNIRSKAHHVQMYVFAASLVSPSHIFQPFSLHSKVHWITLISQIPKQGYPICYYCPIPLSPPKFHSFSEPFLSTKLPKKAQMHHFRNFKDFQWLSKLPCTLNTGKTRRPKSSSLLLCGQLYEKIRTFSKITNAPNDLRRTLWSKVPGVIT